ncbi:Pre protein translocase subunit Sec66-domain-containing protein [Dichotomopilus funicola]|uniref:Pre protein translocase subunit Sec66-domain-containing protein n=1 Tax=Dichotomopilus funicola TaxID=1934379 RepID=A0AAN6UTR6_9PEZI|nr:Pre protein translocase subunit Sec66-domain-containing protein [Dichotomopilus funicola]
MFDINWQGLLLPLAYLVVLVGTFVTFSTVYRKRKAIESANLAPWFGPHLQRNIYLSLLHMQPDENSSAAEKKTQQKIPDSIIRAALIQRAVEDIRRIIQIRTAKQACSSLLQRGSVGDDLWQRFQRAEKEMEEELRDVVMEANALVPGWGQIIFQSANEIAANRAMRERVEEIEAQTARDKEWWEKRRTNVKSAFMKELDAEAAAAAAADTAAAAGAASATPSIGGPGSVAGSADSEPVLVEKNTSSASSSPASKKKGKK